MEMDGGHSSTPEKESVIIILYLLLWPAKINPAAWTPPEAPVLTGVYAENDHLSGIEKMAVCIV